MAQAAAPDNMNQNQGKLPLPLFSAEGSSASTISMEAELFLTRFEDWATVCAYTNARKAKALGYALSKAAATWYQQQCRRGKLNMEDWAAVEAAFRERFVKKVSPRFIASEFSKLTQKPRESVADFLDRCELAQTLLDDQWSVPAAAADRAARLEVTESVHQSMVLHHFLRHIRAEIGDKLAFCQNLESLEDHVKAAERIEKAGTDRQPNFNQAANAAIGAEEIMAIHQRPQQQQQRRKEKRVPGPSYTCKLCNIKGHFITDCPRSEKQKRRQQNQAAGAAPQAAAAAAPPPPPAAAAAPPRHLGAIPKASQWQRPFQQQQAAAINAAAPAAHFQQQQPFHMQQYYAPMVHQPHQPQSLYPVLPHDDFDEHLVSNLSTHGQPQHQAASPDWPRLSGRPNEGFQ